MPDATDLAELALRKSLRLERYADILAHLVHFGPERAEEVLARFGLTLEGWRALDAAWTSELALGMKRQQRDQALRFSATFHARRRRLATEQPAVAAVGDWVGPKDAPLAGNAVPPSASAALPTFMARANHATPGPLPVGPSSAVSPPQGMPVVAPGPVAIGVAAPPPDARAKLTGTMFSPDGPPAAALPFIKGAAEDALKAALKHAELQGPPSARPAAGLGTTAPVNEELAAIARAMPFPGAAPRAASPAASTPATPARPAAPAPTAPASAATASAAPAPAAPTDTLALSLEQHASLTVELALYATNRAAVLQRYRVSADQHASIDAGWRARMAQDQALQEAWNKACATYRDWLEKSARR